MDSTQPQTGPQALNRALAEALTAAERYAAARTDLCDTHTGVPFADRMRERDEAFEDLTSALTAAAVAGGASPGGFWLYATQMEAAQRAGGAPA